jgi:uncharacterized protein (DUF488 family)
MRRIYTVGHGLQALSQLVQNLTAHRIGLVVDVRSHPLSARAPQFSRQPLQAALEAKGVKYAWMGRELGGRPPRKLRTSTGAPDYERMAAVPVAADAIDRLASAAAEWNIVLLCSESSPERCHRSRMLEPEFEKRGVVVEHILPSGVLLLRPSLFA